MAAGRAQAPAVISSYLPEIGSQIPEKSLQNMHNSCA
jgi:hypothetical protein